MEQTPTNQKTVYAVLPAAGSSTRMGELSLERSKTLLPIQDNLSALHLSLLALREANVVQGGVVLVRASDLEEVARIVHEIFPDSDWSVREGGRTRQESVFIGLTSVASKCELLLVHDGARPFCSASLICRVVAAAQKSGAAIAALPVKPSLKDTVDGSYIRMTIPRKNVWEAQTPQVFRADWLAEAYSRAKETGHEATDDSELIERLGKVVEIVRGEDANLKITSAFDLQLARSIVNFKRR